MRLDELSGHRAGKDTQRPRYPVAQSHSLDETVEEFYGLVEGETIVQALDDMERKLDATGG